MDIAEVSVTILGDAPIWWGEAERDYAASQGCESGTADNRASGEVGSDQSQTSEATDCDYDAVIESAEARAYLEKRASETLKSTLVEFVQPAFKGNVPARLSVKVKQVQIVSTGQALLLGGSHFLQAELEVTDIATGASLARYEDLYVTSGYGPGGPIGLVVEAASDDPFVRLSASYADEAKEWLEGEDES